MFKLTLKINVNGHDGIEAGKQDIFVEKKKGARGRPDRYIRINPKIGENCHMVDLTIVNPVTKKDVTEKYDVRITPFECEHLIPTAISETL